MKKDYEDMLELPHHVSTVHPPMPVADRAAQFSPFAALTGYGEVIRETARITEPVPELSEDEREILDYKLGIATGISGKKPTVGISYFQSDEKKAGGSYKRIFGKIKRIDADNGRICMEDGSTIESKAIVDIEICRE